MIISVDELVFQKIPYIVNRLSKSFLNHYLGGGESDLVSYENPAWRLIQNWWQLMNILICSSGYINIFQSLRAFCQQEKSPANFEAIGKKFFVIDDPT